MRHDTDGGGGEYEEGETMSQWQILVDGCGWLDTSPESAAVASGMGLMVRLV